MNSAELSGAEQHDATVEDLPSGVQERLGLILDEYLTAAERGEPISPEVLLERHPEHRDLLRGCLSGLRLFHDAAGAMQDATVAEPRSLSGDVVGAGATIGDFHLVREIGRGGMGVVYEAEQASLKRRVALKVLLFTKGQDEKQRTRFYNEAQAAASVDHPNIVPVFAIGEEGGVPYYAMQLIEGRSLTDVLLERLPADAPRGSAVTLPLTKASTVEAAASHSKTPPCATAPPTLDAGETFLRVREVARLGVQAARALDAAHEFGVVHRDVKPSNLLVDGQDKLWVTDFGLARCRHNTGLTQTGDILGTLRYMSPEQTRGGFVDGRSDIYSLGVTLYELTTLHHPAGDVSDLEIFTKRHDVLPMRHWNRHVPKDFQTIVMKALSTEPAERYDSATEMADDLQRFLDDRPIKASPPSVLTLVGKWARRRRRALLVAAAVAAFVASGTIVMLLKQLDLTAKANAAAEETVHAYAEWVDSHADLADQLKAIPGAEGIRHRMLNETLQLYTGIESRSADRFDQQSEQALAFAKMGDLESRLGDTTDALDHHQSAVAAWRALLASDPSNVEWVRNLAVGLSNAGHLLTETGRDDEAVEAFDEALALLDNLPASRETDTARATTHNNFGLAYRARFEGAEAESQFRNAIALWDQQLEESPADETLLRDLANGYNNLASLLGADDSAVAIETYLQAVDIQRQLVTSQPLNRLYQGDLARTYNNLGFQFSRAGDLRNAEVSYGNAVRLLEVLVTASPYAGAYRGELAVSLSNLGRVRCSAGRFDDAESAFQQAIELQELLVKAQPRDARLLSNLGGMHNNLAMLYDRLERGDDAEAAYREAVGLQRRAMEAAPTVKLYSDLLRNHYANFEQRLRRQGDAAAADRVAEASASLVAKRADGQGTKDIN